MQYKYPYIVELLRNFDADHGFSQVELDSLVGEMIAYQEFETPFRQQLESAFNDPAVSWMQLLWNDEWKITECSSEEEARKEAAFLLWRVAFPGRPLPDFKDGHSS
jgi:hypothetical protein